MNGASTSAMAEGAGPTPKKESRKPKYSKFTQQELPACKPLLTPGWVITTFMIVGVIFIPLGVVCLLASNSVVEVHQRYDDNPACVGNAVSKEAKVAYIQDETTPKNCIVTLTIPKKMNSPVYVYYQLDDFYQNHRRYVKSIDAGQLRKDTTPTESSSSCKPEDVYNGKPIFPCGLIAWSYFNDSYSFTTGNNLVPVNENHISWKSDRDDKFGSALPSNFPNTILRGTVNSSQIGGGALDLNKPLNQNEHLIVWMRTAALPTFRKLWGKIETDLAEGQTLSVNITNQYNTYTFNGKKRLVLSTTSWLGGKNNFLGIAYLTVGLLCVLLAFIFFLIHLKNPRPLGDPSYLSWNKKSPAVANSSG